MRSKPLQIMLFIFTAALALGISAVYIPAYLEELALDRLVLEELLNDSGRRAVWLDGSTGLAVEFTPSDKDCTISWSSRDQSVVAVDADGVLTGRELGSTVITATADTGASVSLNVEVIRKPVPSDSDLPKPYYDVPMIANGYTSIGEYEPDNLVKIPYYLKVNKNGMKMTEETLEAYTRMAQDAKTATGQDLMVISAYRSYQTQQRLYDEDVAYYMARGYSREKAQELTERTTNKPGCSEHQLGNSIDIGTGPSLQYDFYYTAAGRWVTEHAHEYGFILRYPKGKTELTTIDYEAWHFRYVGVEHAAYIHEYDLCLEEYVELLEKARQAAEDYADTISASRYLELTAYGN